MKKIIQKIPGYRFGKKIYCLSGRIKRRLRNQIRPTARILLYHRIADVKNDPYLLAVSPNNFQKQLQYLKNDFRLVSLRQLVGELKTRKITDNTIAITFDDGYADNLYNAVPILKELGIPATIFITAESIGQNIFYWDKDNPDAGRPLSAEELQQLTATALLEVGAHTLTHPRLSKISSEKQEKEIFKSKEQLEATAHKLILGFAYPFGDKNSFTPDIINLVKKAGYHYACANIHERLTNQSNVYLLPRFVVRNWPMEELKKEMKKWI